MRFFADECLDGNIVAGLRQDGLKIVAARESHMGMEDEKVLALANKAKAVLLTEDKDFGELVYRKKQAHFGVVLFRLAGMKPEAKARIASQAFKKYRARFPGAFTVVSAGGIRIQRVIGI